MARRNRRRDDGAGEGAATRETPPICPLCERAIPPGAKASRHHLTPKLKGGAKGETVQLHQICHSAIHARFSETEIARGLNDVESLRAAPALADFLRWVREKPDDFHAPTRMTRDRRNARRQRNGSPRWAG